MATRHWISGLAMAGLLGAAAAAPGLAEAHPRYGNDDEPYYEHDRDGHHEKHRHEHRKERGKYDDHKYWKKLAKKHAKHKDKKQWEKYWKKHGKHRQHDGPPWGKAWGYRNHRDYKRDRSDSDYCRWPGHYWDGDPWHRYGDYGRQYDRNDHRRTWGWLFR